MTAPTDHDHQAQQAIADQLGQIGFAMPGTLLERTMTCGKPNCRCHADPPRLHGPYHQWTRKINGKTVTCNLTDQQADRYRPWFDNARRLRELAAQLEALTLAIHQRTDTD